MRVTGLAKYKDFKEYMEENFYDEIFNRVKSFSAGRRDSFESDEIYNVKWVELDEIHVSGVTFKELEDGFLEIRTSTRSVRRVLERLSKDNRIEYRGSKRTGGWFVKT